MNVREQIRSHLQHGVGSRKVEITGKGEVMVIGSPDGMDHRGWHRVGYIRNVLKEIAAAGQEIAA